MGKFIREKRGFTIKLAGKAAATIKEPEMPETVALKPTDFQGLYLAKALVKEGDAVKAGTPLFHDKRQEAVLFTSPVSGEVVEVKRGEKRKLLEIKVLADRQVEYEAFKKYSVSDIMAMNATEAKEQLMRSGVWTNLVQRPFGIVADPAATPKAIHISAFDTHPLAPDYNILFKGQEAHFQAGIEVLKKLTSGAVHVNVHNAHEIPGTFSQAKGVELNKFAGTHPIGCVGVQIHHIDPINKGDIVWTINPAGVIQIGKLFLNGVYDATRLIAVTGSEVKNPQYYKTVTGASVKRMLENNLHSDHVRVISGNVLTGENIGREGHLGFFDHQLTVLPEGDHHEFLGWIKPAGDRKPSFSRAIGLLNFLSPNKEYKVDTNTHGEPRAFVQSGVFEKVTPMDILPTHLLKSILAQDIDEMEALGIYEVIEEDLALCEFVDVSKHNVQEIIREGIELIRES
ncbi:MAG: Na(+)-translocating NADH-quinone reductase subunit A [Cyclobacteriaceae bacterium]|jgi:Na+-transporting NADH:ubiquinone oxidoreductase subunit A|nr:Na(+)-translocating NADH-quinone reductase subunit A [Cyclobacteriaceae bacterium]